MDNLKRGVGDSVKERNPDVFDGCR